MNGPAAIRPSVWYYSLAAPFLVIGVVIFVQTLLHRMLHITDSLTRVVVPGETKLALKQGASYTVFYEQQSVVNGRIYSANEPRSGLKCSVTSESQRNAIPLRQPSMSTMYDEPLKNPTLTCLTGHQREGQYHFACTYASGSRGPEVVLAVSSGVGEGIMNTVLKSLGAMFGGGALAATVFFTVFFLRERSKKRTANSMQARA